MTQLREALHNNNIYKEDVIVSVDTKIGECQQLKTDFYGSDIRKVRGVLANVRECVDACDLEAGCVAITYNTHYSWCWLKNRKDGADQPTKKWSGTSLNMDCLSGNSLGIRSLCL